MVERQETDEERKGEKKGRSDDCLEIKEKRQSARRQEDSGEMLSVA